MLLAGLAPRRLAEAHRDTPLTRAYFGHVGFLLPGLVGTFLILAQNTDLRREFAPLFDAHFLLHRAGWLIWAIVLLSVEAACLLLSLASLPWGDSRAPIRDLWRLALRTVWLHMGHLVLLSWAYCALLNLCQNYLRSLRWYEPGPAQARSSYTWLLDWMASNYEYALVMLFAAAAIWWVAGLLRAMTANVVQPEEGRAPLCEECGYNLSHHDPSARCPECGRAVERSLSEGLRSPIYWGPFFHAVRQVGFVRASLDAWFNPERLFMSMSAVQGLKSAGTFLLAQLLLTAAAFLVAFALGVSGVLGESLHGDAAEFLFYVGWTGVLVAFVIGVFVSLTAGIVGMVVSRQDRRNCAGGCHRVACFCAGIFPPFVFLLIVSAFVVIELLNSLAPFGWFWLLPLIVFSAIITVVVVFVSAVACRTRFVRYANS